MAEIADDDLSGIDKLDDLLDEISDEDAQIADNEDLPMIELETGIMFPIDPATNKYAAIVHRIEPRSVTRHKDEHGDHIIRISVALTAQQIRDMYLAATGGVRSPSPPANPIRLPPGVSSGGGL